jgi:hypothetical protein
VDGVLYCLERQQSEGAPFFDVQNKKRKEKKRKRTLTQTIRLARFRWREATTEHTRPTSNHHRSFPPPHPDWYDNLLDGFDNSCRKLKEAEQFYRTASEKRTKSSGTHLRKSIPTTHPCTFPPSTIFMTNKNREEEI